MYKGLEALAEMEYPGRFIIIGRDSIGKNNVVVYGLTGRSPSSQARRLIINREGIIIPNRGDKSRKELIRRDSTAIQVEPTNKKIIKQGNLNLLIYPCIEIYKDCIAVSNGKQTEDIIKSLPHHQLIPTLEYTTEGWKYEPDEPNYTPRISGLIIKCETWFERKIYSESALSIIKKAEDGSNIRNYFKFPLIHGKGKLISTYTGINQDPLPSFKGEPLDVILNGRNPKEVSEIVYESLKPKKSKKDFRIGVVTVFQSRKNFKIKVYIINRSDGNKSQ